MRRGHRPLLWVVAAALLLVAAPAGASTMPPSLGSSATPPSAPTNTASAPAPKSAEPAAKAAAPATKPVPLAAKAAPALGSLSAASFGLGAAKDSAGETGGAVRMVIVLTLLALIPAVAICMTPFVRIVVVLSMIRHAFGMPETPPNQVLISLALFLTAFVMAPTLSEVNNDALQPFLAGSIDLRQAIDRGSGPMRTFMLRQVRDEDIKAAYDMAHRPLPDSASQADIMMLTPAFMLNELRVSFKMGFVIFLPFLLIDLVVSSVLLSLGMLMVPPATISLPIKLLMFVLIDGWSLVLQGVVGSIR